MTKDKDSLIGSAKRAGLAALVVLAVWGGVALSKSAYYPQGARFQDVNGDGFQDIVLTYGCGKKEYMLNDGKDRFQIVTQPLRGYEKSLREKLVENP